MTGNPTAPEQAESDNSTKLATTSFVTRAINAIKSSLEVAKLKVTGTLELPGESITEAMLKALAVTGAKIANEAITDAKVVKGRALVETENKYAAISVKTKAEMETGVEFSPTRFALVVISAGLNSVGGVTITGSGDGTVLVPPGQKLKGTAEAGISYILI